MKEVVFCASAIKVHARINYFWREIRRCENCTAINPSIHDAMKQEEDCNRVSCIEILSSKFCRICEIIDPKPEEAVLLGSELCGNMCDNQANYHSLLH